MSAERRLIKVKGKRVIMTIMKKVSGEWLTKTGEISMDKLYGRVDDALRGLQERLERQLRNEEVKMGYVEAEIRMWAAENGFYYGDWVFTECVDNDDDNVSGSLIHYENNTTAEVIRNEAME